MLLDRLKNAHLYFGLHPQFQKVFQQLEQVRPEDFEKKRTEIDGDNAFLLYFDTAGKGPEVKLECHRKYLDIHFVTQGSDLCGYKATSECAELYADNLDKDDYALWNDKPVSEILIPEGYFAIFFPGDAHAPLMGNGAFKKVVAKLMM